MARRFIIGLVRGSLAGLLLLGVSRCGNGEGVVGNPNPPETCGLAEGNRVGVKICSYSLASPQTITLYNFGSTDVSLDQWTLGDETTESGGGGTPVTFSATDVIRAGSKVTAEALPFTVGATAETLYLRDNTTALRDSRAIP